MRRIGIVDYGLNNLDSVARAVQECGGDPLVSKNPADLDDVDALILPGVGAFADAMLELTSRGFDAFLRDKVSQGTPLLGICLGMQLLASFGEEGGGASGLDLVPGRVVRLQSQDARIPHVGWNSVELTAPTPLFAGIPTACDFYFVHSYHFVCDSPDDALAQTDYCGGFTSAVGCGYVFGVQFHPEKSQRNGLALLRNFVGYPLGC